MSKEYGMDPYDDSYDWQQSKKKGWREIDKPNGARVSSEYNGQSTPKVDLVPESVKERFIETAVWLSQNPLPEHISETEAKSTITRGMKYLQERDARRLIMNYKPLVIEPAHKNGTNGHATTPRKLAAAL